MNTITDIDTYQKEVMKTAKSGEDPRMVKLYVGAKMAEEVGEVIGPVSKNIMHGKPLSIEDVKKELGDLCYYVAWMANLHGFTLSDVVTTNIQKIRARHGETYNPGYYTGNKTEEIISTTIQFKPITIGVTGGE